MQRRTFVRSLLAGFGLALTRSGFAAPSAGTNADATTGSLDPRDLLRVTDPGERKGDVLYRKLGRTGERVSAIGMGGAHLSRAPLTEASAGKLVHAALDR